MDDRRLGETRFVSVPREWVLQDDGGCAAVQTSFAFVFATGKTRLSPSSPSSLLTLTMNAIGVWNAGFVSVAAAMANLSTPCAGTSTAKLERVAAGTDKDARVSPRSVTRPVW